MVECLFVTLKVVSSNLGKGKTFFIIDNKVTESMMMVAPSGEQIKSLKSYALTILGQGIQNLGKQATTQQQITRKDLVIRTVAKF